MDEPILEWTENGEKKIITLGQSLEFISEGVQQGYIIFNYLAAVLRTIKAGVLENESQHYSQTGIDMDYDNTKTNPDNESKVIITGGEIELKTLNPSKGITIFGKTYKGIANKSDPTTWTSDYLIDASVLVNFEARISALEHSA